MKAYQSNHGVGEIAYFQPMMTKIVWSFEHQNYSIGVDAIPVRIVGVTFTPSKVLYDIALPDGDGGYYEARPLMRVDSYFVHGKESVRDGGMIGDLKDKKDHI